MTSFIGPPGALAEIACPASEVTSPDRTVSELVPFSGERIVQLGRRVRRSWSIDHWAAHPRDYAVLDALARWESPLVWVGALAQATNLLTPEQATLQAAKYGGSGHQNLAQNPWFRSLQGQFGVGNITGGSGSSVAVDDVWPSGDGSCLRVNPGSTAGSAYLMPLTGANASHGGLAGKEITVGIDIYLQTPQTGSIHGAFARAIGVGIVDASGSPSIPTENWSENAPNEAGVHRLVARATIPADAQAIYLYARNGSTETPVWFSALTIEEGATSGLWFDGSAAGARTGLLNIDGMPVVTWAGGPIGGQINVTGDQPVPVIPGTPVTVSIWGKRAGQRTSARLSYWFRDVTGAQVEAATLSGSSSDDLVRRSWTLTPPPGAATLSVLIRDAAILALPQVTWTDGPVDWAPGRGVHRVVVVPGSESPIVAHRRQVLTGAAYTILEVG